jgi:hypothetical protein
MHRRALLCAALLAVAGCGSQTLSRDDFLRRGNAECAATRARIARLATPARAHLTAPAAAGYLDAYVAEVRQEIARLRGIGYPRGDRKRLRGIYRKLETRLTTVQRDPRAFRPAALAPMGAELRKYGLTACGP